MEKFSRNRSLFISVAIVVAAVLMLGCAGSNKIIKSGDPALIYQTAMKHYNAEKWHRAAGLFEACIGYYIGTQREDSLTFFMARSRFKHRDYHAASETLEEFRRKFGRSVFIEDAEAMLAMCHYYLSPPPTRDQTLTAQAIVSLSEFIERYPESRRNEAFSQLIDELTLRLHEKNYLNAYTYFKIRKYKSAVVAFKNALKNYANTSHREDIMYYIVVSNYQLAHNSISEKQADRYMSVLDSYYTFIEEFPDSKHIKELQRYVKEAKDYMDKNNIEKQQ